VRRRSGAGLAGLVLALALASAPAAAQENALRYRLVSPAEASARPVAEKLLRHLANGDLEGAAALSTAPERRFEELSRYRGLVGDAEFKRVFGRYFAPQNRLVAEVADGPHRLLVWDLGEAGHHIAGQYYLEIAGTFLMDEKPSEARARLQRILQAYRDGKIKF
jgi:hypothetical protein